MGLLFIILKKISTVQHFCLRDVWTHVHYVTRFGTQEVLRIKSSLGFFSSLFTLLLWSEAKPQNVIIWNSFVSLQEDTCCSPSSCAENSSLKLFSGTASMSGKESQELGAVFWRRLSKLGRSVCVMATQNCSWQAKWPWAILIPSSLIFLSVLWGTWQYPHSVDKETVSLK